MQTRNTSRGFSLIELMVVVGIVAVLAVLATNSYSSSVRKSRRTEARTALLDLASREERFMSTNSSYTRTLTELGYSAGSLPLTVGNGYYSVDIPVINFTAATSNTPARFTITAAPVAGKGQDKDSACATFSVDSTGLQSSTNSGGASTTATCWN